MGFLDYILGFQSEAPSIFPHDPNDDRAWNRSTGSRDYWGGHSGPSSTGLYIRPDDALGVSCIFLGVRIYSEVLGTLPLNFYREGSDGKYTPLPKHPIGRLLSPSRGLLPNPWQTSAQWRITTIAHAMLWGLGLSEITFGEEGLQLLPIDPEWISDIETTKGRKSRFKVSEPGQPQRILTQDQVFSFEGFGTHSRIPESLLRRSRQAVGAWLAHEMFRSNYFLRGAQPSLIATHEGVMKDEAFNRFQKQLSERVGGLRNAHKIPLIEDNVKLQEVGDTARNAQTVEMIEAQAVEIGTRFFGLPPHFFGGKAPPYASREYVMQELVSIHFQPKGTLFEAAVHRDLITEDDVVCEHDYDRLKQGSFLEQVQAYAQAIMAGIMSENEARDHFGLNRVPGLDEPRRSVNQDRGGDPQRPQGAQADSFNSPSLAGSGVGDISRAFDLMSGRLVSPSADDRHGNVAGTAGETVRPLVTDTRAIQLLTQAATKLLKRELDNVRTRAVKVDADTWKTWLVSFYRTHAQKMAADLAIDVRLAEEYAREHRQALLREGIGVCEEWEKVGVREAQGVEEMVKLSTGKEMA